MLGIGMQEILIILVVALIVIGPKRLPELAKTLGKGFAEFRKAADDLQETVRMDLQREKHEEFKQKYPGIVPEESEAVQGAAPDTTKSGEAEAGQNVSPDEAGPETKPSYDPGEIEGGDLKEDNSRDA